MKISNQEKIQNLLTRNVEDLIVKEEIEKKLNSGKKLRIKLGIDPTNPQIHIGRAVALWKLREFQDLGHKITLVIGTFTGVIGDASDKDSERPMVDKKVIEDNAKLYAEQISKILDIKKVEFFYNGDWFNKMKLQDFFKLTSLFTIQQMIERENFANRIKANKPVGIHETLYPMLQGYDSVEMKTDIEVGGTDQLFNLLAGRTVQKAYDMTPQSVMTFSLMEGTDGRKMSSSWGNCIYITDEPDDMYGKVMTVRDELIPSYFRMATDVRMEVIEQIEKDMSQGDNPRDTKASLARAIVARYHGEQAANDAEDRWNKQFREGNKPKDIDEIKIKPGKLIDVVSMQFDLSKSEVRRLVSQGGIKLDDEVVKDIDQKISKSVLVQVGKRRFVKFKI
ncbi:MAG: tyrosyl-tRNA synthetase [Patescibacteria group bacterium]|jgi:tyrosyl-tRNA synthetase|nr:tyrosyl-tRNA synthetase [Patescibacteria group bacterium]